MKEKKKIIDTPVPHSNDHHIILPKQKINENKLFLEKILIKEILILIRDYLVCLYLKNEEEDESEALRPIVNEMERYELNEGNRSWRNFLSTGNSSIWKTIRKETRIFALNNHYSFTFSLDKTFQDIVLRRMKDPSSQLSLQFTESQLENLLEEAHEKHISIPQLLQNLYSLNCSNNSNVESFPELKSISTVILKGCSNLLEFSAKEIKSLNLFGCRNLQNLSFYSCEQLLELKIIGCPFSSYVKSVSSDVQVFIDFFSQFLSLQVLHINYHPEIMSKATFWQAKRSSLPSQGTVSSPFFHQTHTNPSHSLFTSLRELCLAVSPEFSPNEKIENILLPALPLPSLTRLELRGILLLSLVSLGSLRSLKITEDPSENYLSIHDASSLVEDYKKKLLHELTDHHGECCCPYLSSFSYRNQNFMISRNLLKHFDHFPRLRSIDLSYSQFQEQEREDAKEFEEYEEEVEQHHYHHLHGHNEDEGKEEELSTHPLRSHHSLHVLLQEEQEGTIFLPNSIDTFIIPYTDFQSIVSDRLNSHQATHSYHFHQLDLSATSFPINKSQPLPSAFQFITKVLLEECELTDISPLSHVPYLSLAYCKGIQDYTVLGRQQYLNVKQNQELLSTDLQYFGNIPYLNISECSSLTSIPKDSLMNNLYVIADSCDQLKYVEWAGKNYVKISLDYNRLIVVVTGVIQVVSLEESYVSFQESPHEQEQQYGNDYNNHQDKVKANDLHLGHHHVDNNDGAENKKTMKKDRRIDFIVGKYTMF